jgi:site-specific recombinase XerD
MIKKRVKLVGLPTEITRHSFKGTGTTNYLSNGGDIKVCAEMANHSSIRTSQFYDHRGDLVDKSEVDKVRL